MTIEAYEAPGTEEYRSSRYSVGYVNDDESVTDFPYVYGVAREAEYSLPGFWGIGASPGMNFITFGTDSQVEVAVTLLSGPITTFRVYPRAKAYTSWLVDGVLHIIMPVRSKVWIETNFNPLDGLDADSLTARANPLFVSADTLRPAVPEGAITYDGTQLKAGEGETLYFGPGVWNLTTGSWGAKLFPVSEGATVYVDGGAWVIGSFDVRGSNNVTITGPGVLSGEWTTPEIVHALVGGWPVKYEYAMIVGLTYGVTPTPSGNNLSRVTIVNPPFRAITEGLNGCYDVKLFSPWFSNCDGLSCTGDAANGYAYTIQYCMCWSGDDCYDLSTWRGNGLCTQNIGASTGSSVFLMGYGSQNLDWWPFKQYVIDNYAVCVADYYDTGIGPEGGEIIKGWADETSDHSTWGLFDVTIDGLDVEGPIMRCPLFGLKNKVYPWGVGEDAAGQISGWTLKNIRMQRTPADRSMLKGLDATNTPHDCTFWDIVSGIDETAGARRWDRVSWSTYVDQNGFPYNISKQDKIPPIVIPPVVEPPVGVIPPDPGEIPVTLTVEDGTGLATAESYISVADATTYIQSRANPVSWTSATTTEREVALRLATEYLDQVYGERFKGQRGSSTQALEWPRVYVYDQLGAAVTGVPTKLAHATAEVAMRYVAGTVLMPDVSAGEGGVASMSVGPISATFNGAADTAPRFPVVEKLLKLGGLIADGSWATR